MHVRIQSQPPQSRQRLQPRLEELLPVYHSLRAIVAEAKEARGREPRRAGEMNPS